ncbi:MAG: glycosyltransferase family 4 protein [Planktomarina sp.]
MILDVPRCLDITRLMRRAGRMLTGVDRVERAYLRQLLSMPNDVFGLAQTSFGFLVLDRKGLETFDTLLETQNWDRPDFMSKLFVRDLQRGKVESSLRKIAVNRCRPTGLQDMLCKTLPSGVHYLSIGHSNISPKVLSAIASIPCSKSAVMFHDTIPLDQPQFQRKETPPKFYSQLKVAAGLADIVLTVSEHSAERLKYHFRPFGRIPDIIPAHLGVANRIAADPNFPIPQKPYFVALGTIEPRKNHQLLLDAWEELTKFPDAPDLWVIGARGWKNETVFKRMDAGPQNIFEENALTDPQVMALLQNANGLLMPSLAEGFGLPAIEAAAINIPLVLSDLPPYREFLGELPVYLNPNDKYQWINAIRALCENDGQIKDHAYTPPTWEAHFAKVLSRI